MPVKNKLFFILHPSSFQSLETCPKFFSRNALASRRLALAGAASFSLFVCEKSCLIAFRLKRRGKKAGLFNCQNRITKNPDKLFRQKFSFVNFTPLLKNLPRKNLRSPVYCLAFLFSRIAKVKIAMCRFNRRPAKFPTI